MNPHLNLPDLVNFLKRKRIQCNPKKMNTQYQFHSSAILNSSNGNIISIGHNTHYVMNSNKFGMEHAEINALKKIKMDKKIKNINIDIVVIRTNGGNSKPCSDCINKFVKSGLKIRKIYYSNIINGKLGLNVNKLDDLINDNEKHITSFHRNRHMVNICCNHTHELDNDGDEDMYENDDDESAKNKYNSKYYKI